MTNELSMLNNNNYYNYCFIFIVVFILSRSLIYTPILPFSEAFVGHCADNKSQPHSDSLVEFYFYIISEVGKIAAVVSTASR